ncbi:hypothetical protein OG225_06390 [Nocardia sp. NBC_01377]|uniref:hypothetical protein n=1 Tax=Nocardia sp. NBC_01377 TaxID=2903595 RepID=UPI00324F7171
MSTNDDHRTNTNNSTLGTTAHRVRETVMVMVLAHIPFYSGLTHLWSSLALLIAIATTSLLISVGMLHRVARPLCEQCAEQVPNDPTTSARRNRLLLWIYHRRWHRYWMCVTACLLVAYALNRYAGFPRLAFLPMDLLAVARMYGHWLHPQLTPWCPYCRWGRDDEGDAITEPSPDPSMAAIR